MKNKHFHGIKLITILYFISQPTGLVATCENRNGWNKDWCIKHYLKAGWMPIDQKTYEKQKQILLNQQHERREKNTLFGF